MQLNNGGHGAPRGAPRSPVNQPGSGPEARVHNRLHPSPGSNGGGRKPPAGGGLPKHIDFVGPLGWQREVVLVERAVDYRNEVFTYGGAGKFWENQAEALADHELFRKQDAPVGGKLLMAKMTALVKEGEKMLEKRALNSGPPSSGFDNAREQLLMRLLEAKREVEAKKETVVRRTKDDRDRTDSKVAEAVAMQASGGERVKR